MEKKPTSQSMRDSVLQAIESGRVTMRPRWKFATQTALLLVGTVLAALTALYLASFIVFTLRQTGVWSTPSLGLRGINVFLFSLPWILVIVSLVFMLLLQILIKRYAFAYGRPFMYSALGIMVLVGCGGIIIGFTPFHQQLFDRAEHQRLPFAGPFYHQYGQQPGNVTVGSIIKLGNNIYTLEDPHGEIFSITLSDQTQLPPGLSLQIGDVVVVLGERKGTTIAALAIQKPASLPPHSGRDRFDRH